VPLDDVVLIENAPLSAPETLAVDEAGPSGVPAAAAATRTGAAYTIRYAYFLDNRLEMENSCAMACNITQKKLSIESCHNVTVNAISINICSFLC